MSVENYKTWKFEWNVLAHHIAVNRYYFTKQILSRTALHTAEISSTVNPNKKMVTTKLIELILLSAIKNSIGFIVHKLDLF